MAFDGQAYVSTLTQAGVPAAQAEAHLVALRSHILPDLVTRQDLKILGTEMRLEIAELRLDFRSAVASIRSDMWKIMLVLAAATAALATMVPRIIA